jgi:Zn-dependent protease with chaperone function
MLKGFTWLRRAFIASAAPETDAARVRRIADRLLAAIGRDQLAAKQRPRRAVLVHTASPNAYCLRDGSIVVTTGLLHALELTDDELAFVIGHEIAHCIHGHRQMQTGNNLLIGIGTALSALLFGTRSGQWAYVLGQLASLRLSRGSEKQADRTGMRLASKAGFDPQAALSLWRKAKRLQAPLIPWLSDHPSTPDRLANLRVNLASQ